MSRRSTVMDPSTPFRRVVPVDHLVHRITPVDDVYVVAHLGVARVDASRWRLVIDGLVEHRLELDLAALTALPAIETTAVLECFGNPLEPDVPTRRAGNLVWRGARLADLLDRAGLKPAARFVWAEGLDHGRFADVDSDRYLKDIPLARAMAPDVLLAWEMNGRPLAPEHGFPVRLFVPGYFGTNQVKWLSRLTLAETRPEGLFTTRLYNRRVIVDDEAVLRPARELDVQAVIVTPADGAELEPGPHAVTGWAWSAWDIRSVDVSTDGGATWQPAAVGPSRTEREWRPFMRSWNATPGVHRLQARATDDRGRVQPEAGRNSIHTVTVTVG